MIRQMKENEISECVKLISDSFMTVANEFGFTIENAPRFTAFATTSERLRYHRDVEKRPMYVSLLHADTWRWSYDQLEKTYHCI